MSDNSRMGADDVSALVHVAVAVILGDDEQVLLTQRHADSHQGGLWEFPGGKLESGESLSGALLRELREELGIEVSAHHALLRIEHDYGDKRVLLDVHCVTEFEGEPSPCEGQPMRWVGVSELGDYAFPEANGAIVRALVSGAR
ncbi:8-oxo-dGTP diphosphatase MutT [Congregibacter brevis]|uniref:8-oxo-dGTP diphosphatase n=1 Tax=Congregibacter brevis TaxID=3081201 RepID=A0ABZ0IFS0_9GAMM|nr:8-oxo-dGTP diphosphatase MutT [Congregibacter sp. IMCC45268]